MEQRKRVVIAANGSMDDSAFHSRILSEADVIICADGGANRIHELGFTPDMVIGDLDSITAKVHASLRGNGRTKVIEDPDQDKTDLELAIAQALKLAPFEIIIIGAIGTRLDHTLANALSLSRIPPSLPCRMMDEHNTVWLVSSSLEVKGAAGSTLSVIAASDVKGLTYAGLKWCISNKDVPSGWIGISNRMAGETARISLRKGMVLVMQSVDAQVKP
ncbi:TPA: thiamine diphosphokinase [Candidatus Woesearchaeota archaeon]|nr:thiamine diphosphokinase [Candidatus Woesearchaeota archaeon]HII69122.1 thiamine diphosphokinase [Candidatus Woesearchaeota archaeon]